MDYPTDSGGITKCRSRHWPDSVSWRGWTRSGPGKVGEGRRVNQRAIGQVR